MAKRAPNRLVVARGAAKIPTPQPPQRWQLAAKQEIDASRLVRDKHDTIGRFFLGLALAFNDLKGLVLFEQYLKAMGRPDTVDYSPHFGQWHGVNVQIQRSIAGVLHETMNVIAAPQFKTVVDGKQLADLVASLGAKNRTAWQTLVATARAPQNQTNMSTLLARIRNMAAFHYGNKGSALSDAFTELFVNDATKAPTGANKAAAFSVGVDMDGTRFYYADAATQQVMKQQIERAGESIETIFCIAENVNFAIAAVLGAFIRHRST